MMKNTLKTLSRFAVCLMMIGAVACSDDEPGGGGPGGGEGGGGDDECGEKCECDFLHCVFTLLLVFLFKFVTSACNSSLWRTLRLRFRAVSDLRPV